MNANGTEIERDMIDRERKKERKRERQYEGKSTGIRDIKKGLGVREERK